MHVFGGKKTWFSIFCFPLFSGIAHSLCLTFWGLILSLEFQLNSNLFFPGWFLCAVCGEVGQISDPEQRQPTRTRRHDLRILQGVFLLFHHICWSFLHCGDGKRFPIVQIVRGFAMRLFQNTRVLLYSYLPLNSKNQVKCYFSANFASRQCNAWEI